MLDGTDRAEVAPARPQRGLQDISIAEARRLFIRTGDLTPRLRSAVRPEIAMSWLRSRGAGVNPDTTVQAPIEAGASSERLLTLSEPVLSHLREALADSGAELVLADGGARVVAAWRLAGDNPTLQDCAAVGLSLREEHVGTNAVGTALADGFPKVITGHEHWSRSLTGRTCVAVPVQHPVTRRSAAVIGVALPQGADARAMLALLRWAAIELKSALHLQEGDRTRNLVDQYLCRRRPDRSSMLLTDELCVADTRAAALLSSLDLAVLRSEVQRSGPAASSRRSITLGDGASVDATVSTLGDDESLYVELDSSVRRQRPAGAGESTSTLLAQALRSLDAGLDDGVPVLLTGEPGSGKLTAARRALEKRGATTTIDVSEDVDAEACIGEIRAAALRGDGIVLGHLDRCRPDVLADLYDILNALLRTGNARVAATAFAAPSLDDGQHSSTELAVYALFAERQIVLPSLRERPNDIPRLVAAVGEARGRRVRWAPDALDALMRLPWRGNLRELEQVVLRTLARNPSVITKADLPADVRAQVERHRLSWMERVERDALLAALDASGGNKVQAALELGISRSSLYRKISQFGL